MCNQNSKFLNATAAPSVITTTNRRGRGASLCVEDAGDCGLKNEAYQKINFQINYKKLFKLIANLKGINCHVKIEQSV